MLAWDRVVAGRVVAHRCCFFVSRGFSHQQRATMNEHFCACGMQHDPATHAKKPEVDETSEVLLSEVGSSARERCLRFDLHSHILPKQWPSLSEKYGEGPWIQLQHTRDGYANMMRSNK